ncbi:zinc dependent phospholipase C family protein [Halobacteriovorax sp. RZ-2]|uniref:zinc dependent phospholipase C family protein n=1 Tax=unclassified Halobacteriovorax TaxID=2639665 RepID=UPI00371A2938
MPAGFTHILLAKHFTNESGLDDSPLGFLLDEKLDYFQLGAVGPDLPYSQVTSKEMKEIADLFHNTDATCIPIKALEEIRRMPVGDQKDECFAFFLGFISHIVADGIIHPFVRDKVGPYKEGDNATKHRLLEMRLDVIFSDYIQKADLNCANFQDELKNPLASFDHVAELFSKCINSSYSKYTNSSDIKMWVKCMELLFESAANENNQYYSIVPGLSGFLYKDKSDILASISDDLILTNKTIDGRSANFRNSETHFLKDCVPKFFEALKPISQKAYGYVYETDNIHKFDNSDLPAINLDTGRRIDLSNGIDGYNLNEPAVYWEL